MKCFSALALGKPVPMVIYTDWQVAAMRDTKFVRILHLLGFNVPASPKDGVFPNMLAQWTAKEFYHKAKLLGPLEILNEWQADAIQLDSSMDYSQEYTDTQDCLW